MANIDLTKVFKFKNIPKKRKYVIDRLKKMYNVPEKELENLLDKIKLVFRKQKEKGASDHKKKKVYISFNELNKYDIDDEKEFLKYLEHPKSVITHETMHIFQNIYKAFPDKKYLCKNKSGDWKIDYDKYVTDEGENQSRIEQIIELLDWGFTKSEIVNFLYNREQKDQKLWRILVDQAKKIRKMATSKLPYIDENDKVENEQGREDESYLGLKHKKQRGRNYDKDYLSSGHLGEGVFI